MFYPVCVQIVRYDVVMLFMLKTWTLSCDVNSWREQGEKVNLTYRHNFILYVDRQRGNIVQDGRPLKTCLWFYYKTCYAFNPFTTAIPKYLSWLGKEFVMCEICMCYFAFLNFGITLWMFNFITKFKGCNQKDDSHRMCIDVFRSDQQQQYEMNSSVLEAVSTGRNRWNSLFEKTLTENLISAQRCWSAYKSKTFLQK
jgi:hypothetical protein